MRIALEASWAQGRPTGIGMYVRELLAAFDALPDENEYFLLHWHRHWAGPALGPRFTPVSYWCGCASIAMAWRLGRVLRRIQPDIYHATAATGVPRAAGAPVVATVHDLYRFYPECRGSTWQKALFRRQFRATAARAAHFITNSRFTAEDLQRLFGVSERRMTPIPLAPAGTPVQTPTEPRDLLLCLGGVEPRKGQLFLLDVYEALLRLQPDAPPLVFAGPDRGDGMQLRQALKRPGLAGRVTWCEYVSDSERERLYARAQLFLMPSSFEGFGLPLLEAMARDVPAVASDIPVFREVAGDAARLVPLGDPARWATAVAGLLGDEAQIERLVAAGHAHSARFTWETCARRTLACYARVLAERGGA